MNRAQEMARNADEMEYVYDFRGIPLHCRLALDATGPASITECLFDGDDFDIGGVGLGDGYHGYKSLTVSILHDAHIAWERQR